MTTTAYSQMIQSNCYEINVFFDPFNKRIRLDDVRGNVLSAIQKAEEITAENQAEKLIIKARKEQFIALLEKGYACEGVIDRYFLGSDMYFFCKYFADKRGIRSEGVKEDEIVRDVQRSPLKTASTIAPSQYTLQKVSKEDAEQLAELYKKVFKVYPTPLHNPDYIQKTIAEGTIYFVCKYGEEIVSAASAEKNSHYKNAELTDCATLPEHRKFGLMRILLEQLEIELVNEGFYCLYSLARSLSYGMNAVLHQLNYEYRGRLTNNCYIYEKFENMNIWVKNFAGSH